MLRKARFFDFLQRGYQIADFKTDVKNIHVYTMDKPVIAGKIIKNLSEIIK